MQCQSTFLFKQCFGLPKQGGRYAMVSVIWCKEADEAGLTPVETSAILKVPCIW